ncbi:Spindle pole body component [Tolypocladium capitatum]|uniref:Spindle pole body component n=1 Tax=Tolypocladium capitatum TaxID=45235 RepID=A0A2K3QDX2_9HYPO|nr:Spindle pole body component [Tolypocladium capitatum]
MAGDENAADVFAIPDFWQTSAWLEQLVQEAPTPLFARDLHGEPIRPCHEAKAYCRAAAALGSSNLGFIPYTPITLAQDGFFKLPPLDIAEAKQPDARQEEVEGFSTVADSTSDAEVEFDPWMDLEEPSDRRTGLRTWDGFDSGRTAAHQPMFVSEAGPAAYDALLSWSADPLELGNWDVPVVEAKTYFSSLLALALGRDSVFFRKEDERGPFKPALPKMRISGYSRQILQGLESQALWCGSTLLELNAFVRSAYAAYSSRCGVALASSIGQILHAVEQRVAVDGRNPRSLLQLQSTIADVSTILKPFKKLASQLRPTRSDHDILSLVFHTISSLDDGEEYVRDILREILRRVSAPWVELMEEWIGTRRESGIPLTKSNLGETKGFVKVEAEAYVDDFGREEEDVDFRLDRSKVPDFMPSDVMDSIFETGRNLRFIRSFHPDHPLAQQAEIESSQPPKADWLYDWSSILELESRVSQYRDRLNDALRRSRRSTSLYPLCMVARAEEPGSMFRLDFFGLDQMGMEERILASINQLDQPMAEPSSEDTLGVIVRQRLSDRYRATTNQPDATPHRTLLPVLSFGGIASAQAQIVNQESLRLLFNEHDLRAHLGLQRNFSLLGNGIFCSRLSHALFDLDLESAEREAGVARQGGVMGLRLGGRDTWPPASSELRLALAGVLAESFGSHKGSRFRNLCSASGKSSGLPGDLSFAVRELSPEEIDKCTNPDSLEALDFLRLSYKAPPELASIITTIHLMNYDGIFKLLLRVLRMLYVVNQLHRDINSGAGSWRNPSNASYRFAKEAQHFISSIASYFFDTGVALPWQAFERKLDKVQADLDSHKDNTATERLRSPDQLRELHSHVLDRIMFALFLKKRQLPVLKLLEGMFSTVLRYAMFSRLQALGRADETRGDEEAAELYTDLKKKMQVFITVCRGLSEKGRGGGSMMFEELGVGDDSLVAQLLTKLDMGDYYCKH